MHYEERITLTIKYYAEHLGQKITKAEARQSLLTQEQFLEVNEEARYRFVFRLSSFSLAVLYLKLFVTCR